MLESGGEQRVTGYEGHHELRRGIDPLPVLLLGQRVDVGLHLATVTGQAASAKGFVVGLVGVQESLHGYLGIDRHIPPAGKMHDHVRSKPTAVGVRRHLLVKVAVLEHARHLDHSSELQFTPTAAGLRGSQGGDQIAGLLLQLVVRGGQVLHLFGERRVGPLPFHLETLDSLLVPAESAR